jgi:AMP deaminase
VKNTEALKDPAISFQFGKDGVVELFAVGDHDRANNLSIVPNIEDFRNDYMRLVKMVSDGAMRSFCFQRLQLLSSAFRMHTTMNGPVEAQEQSNLLGTDFYRTLKVDNHIHAAAAPRYAQWTSHSLKR